MCGTIRCAAGAPALGKDCTLQVLLSGSSGEGRRLEAALAEAGEMRLELARKYRSQGVTVDVPKAEVFGHDPSKCLEHGAQSREWGQLRHDPDCCGLPDQTTCANGYTKVETHRPCHTGGNVASPMIYECRKRQIGLTMHFHKK